MNIQPPPRPRLGPAPDEGGAGRADEEGQQYQVQRTRAGGRGERRKDGQRRSGAENHSQIRTLLLTGTGGAARLRDGVQGGSALPQRPAPADPAVRAPFQLAKLSTLAAADLVSVTARG
ncbi:hypothetical protein GCM10020218_059660 [Dactylosporangium vinaceum]